MLFGGKKKRTVAVLADVTGSSVGVAYALVGGSEPAAIIYSTRIPVATTGEGPSIIRIFRALDEALQTLRTGGAPILRKTTGSGSADTVYVSLGAALQETSVRSEVISDKKPFVFTSADFDTAVKRLVPPDEKHEVTHSVVATFLNGYEVENPVGKRAQSAEIVLLSTVTPTETSALVRRALSGFSGHRTVTTLTFAPLIAAAVERAFPHERDYIAIRVTGEATELCRVSRGRLADVTRVDSGLARFANIAKKGGYQSFPDGGGIINREGGAALDTELTAAKREWVGSVVGALKEFAASRALPRRIFLLADADAAEFLRRTLDAPEMRALWLSDEPLGVFTLGGLQLAPYVTHPNDLPEDVPVELLALAARAE